MKFLKIKRSEHILGYRDYAKDYEIEYLERPSKKRPKMNRIYIGPYYRFNISDKQLRKLRFFYLINMVLLAVCQLIPMCVDSAFSRTWYIEVPAVCAWIPWLLASGSTYRLWTVREKVDREHYELMHDRMSGASLFLMGFHAISAVGCIMQLSNQPAASTDYLICACCLGAVFFSAQLFTKRKELEMVRMENPEKSHKCK